MKILFLTRYGRVGASSRVRLLQYLPSFEAAGWRCDIFPLLSDEYVRALYSGGPRVGQVVSGFFQRLGKLLHARCYNLLWVEKEIFPFLPAFAERLLDNIGVPFVVDYDDALFHRYDCHPSAFVRGLLGRKIDAVMRHATVVVAGNRYLAARAKAAGARQIEIIPTVVDRDRYQVTERAGGPITLGWIGSPVTATNLQLIAKALAGVQRRYGVRIRLIGSGAVCLKGVDAEIVAWEEAHEPGLIAAIDIGLMPLRDSPWERGKCGYKLIQYMACARPVVASPVGVNVEIVRPSENGWLAVTDSEWQDALGRLIQDEVQRRRMGNVGRSLVENTYSLQVQAPRLEQILTKAAQG